MLFTFGQVKSERSAGIHDVVRVEVLLQGTQHVIFVFAERTFQPRGKHLADAVVVAHCRAGLLNCGEDARVIGAECLRVTLLDDEDEVYSDEFRVLVSKKGKCEWKRDENFI